MKPTMQFLLVIFLTLFFQCEREDENPSDFIFPDLENIESIVYDEIKKTCETYWDLSKMIDTTFEIYPDGNEYSINCDGYYDEALYHFVIRVDEYGKWINDGRTKKK